MTTLQQEIAHLLDHIPIDFGGGCSIRKAHLMAWLIRRFQLRTTVDIGVYRGRSLYPQALAHQKYTGGMVYGVDPWDPYEAMESDNAYLRSEIKAFVGRTDFEGIYAQVKLLRERLTYQEFATLLRMTSADAADLFESQGVFFDLIHIDGNHDTCRVVSDVESYLPRLNRRGFVILDDVSWESVKPAADALASRLTMVHRVLNLPYDDYAVYCSDRSVLSAALLRQILQFIHPSPATER